MNSSHTRRQSARPLTGSGTHTAALRLLGIAATLALILQMLSPLIPAANTYTAFADNASPTAVESSSDSTQPVTPTQPEGPAINPASDVGEQPIADTTAPVVSVPATIFVTADAGTSTADVQFGDQIWAVDDVDGPLAVTADPGSGAFPVGDTTVTVTATDAAGNVGSATFVVSVSAAPLPTDVPRPTAMPSEEPTVIPVGAPVTGPMKDETKPQSRTGSADTNVAALAALDTTLTAPTFSGVVNGTVRLSATLRATDGTPVGGKLITFTLNGVVKTATTATTTSASGTIGVAQLSSAPSLQMPLAGLAPGSYAYTATFAGDATYTGVSSTGTITVVSTILGTTLTLDPTNPTSGPFASSVILKATLQTTAGAPVVGKYVTVGAAGSSSYGAYTNENGIASVSFSTVNPYLPPNTYTILAKWTGDPNYSASTSAGASLTITQGTPTITFTTSTLTQTYNSNARTVTVTCVTPLSGSCTGQTVLSYSGTNGTVYGPSATAPINVGTYSVVATINNVSWYLQATATLIVNQGTATLTLTGADLTRTYDGAAKAVRFTVTPAALASSVVVTYTGIAPTDYPESTTAPTDAGSYTVVATLTNPNVTSISRTGTLVISKAPATLDLVTADLAQSVGSTTPVGFIVTPTTLASSVMVTYTGIEPTVYGPATTPPTTAGSYTVVASLTHTNYTVADATGTLVISGPSITPTTLTLSGLAATYDGNPHAVSVTTDPAGQEADVTLLYTGIAPTAYPESSVAPTDAGSYTVTATLNTSTHAGSATDTLVISPLTVTITPESGQSKVFGTTGPVLTFTNDGGLATSTFTGALSRMPGEDVGTYAIISGDLSAGANYNLVMSSTPVTFEITKASATIELVVADLTQTVGSTMPVGFTVVPDTLASSVIVTYTGIDPTIYGSATTPPTAAGSYTVVASLTNANYTAPDATGTLVIIPAPVPVFLWPVASGITGDVVTIYGWTPLPGEEVRITWQSGPVLGTVTADDTGKFILSFRIPLATPATYAIVATGLTSSATGQVDYTITGVAPIPVFLWPVASGITGDVVTIYGWTPLPGEEVRITWQSGPVLGTVTADDTGKFILSFRIPLATPATYAIVATGLTSSATGQVDYTITGVAPALPAGVKVP